MPYHIKGGKKEHLTSLIVPGLSYCCNKQGSVDFFYPLNKYQSDPDSLTLKI